MVCSSAIEKIKLIVVNMLLINGKEGESSPALAVAASLESVGEGVVGSGLLLCLWAKISTGPWTVHSNVIEK